MSQQNTENNQTSDEIVQIFLLRGLARESRHWGEFLNDLESAYRARGKSLRIESIDLPGCGRHSEMRSSATVEASAEFARSKMKDILAREAREGVRPATHRRLVAISLGGMIGSAWLDMYPGDFHSAVLINSSFRGFSKPYDRLRWESWWRIPSVLSEPDIETREKKILDWISNRADRRNDVLKDWLHIQQTRPVSAANIILQLTAASRFTAPARIATPLLVLASRGDRMVNVKCSEAISERYSAPIHIHPTAGHDLPLDAGPWVATMISEW